MNVFILLILVICSESAKILGIFHMPARSHFILGSTLMKELAEKGHEVTFISSFKDTHPPKNGTYTEIVLTELFEEMQGKHTKYPSQVLYSYTNNKILAHLKTSKMFDMADSNMFLKMFDIQFLGEKMCDKTLSNPKVQELIGSTEKFDVVIIEQFLNEAEKALAHHFKAPLIVFSTVGANSWINHLVGNSAPPSYIPEIMLSFSSKMSFFQRVTNSLFSAFHYIMTHLITYPQQAKIMKKHFPSIVNIEEVIYNTSIILLNSHSSINQPVPLTPNMIEIGGYHVQPPKQLPKDLQQFMDNATDGVIYFSLGSNLKSTEMSLEKRQAFLKTFAKLKQKILWKWEEDTLPDQPRNVKLGKWLPQQDILAHPNIKLFITHGGLLSTIETIYHGVPILAIPIFGDQKMNAANAVEQGYGLLLNYQDVNEEKLTEKLTEILNNPKYKQTAMLRSKILHDQQVKPMEKAIFWIEYVIRNKGAPFFRVAALDLTWYQYLMLDVTVFIIFILLLSFFCLYFIIKTFKRQKLSKVKKS